MLWIVILLVNFISAVFKKCEIIIGGLSFVIMGFIVGTVDYNTNPDAIVYLADYVNRLDSFESGYNFLTRIAWNQFSYAEFRLYSSVVVYILLFLIILTLTKHVSMIAFFYMIAMLTFDCGQVRNGMVSLFILLGATMLVKFNNKGIIPALIIIYAGSFFHSIALYFLLLPIVWILRKEIYRHYYVYFLGLSGIAFIFEIFGSTSLMPILTDVVSKFSNRSSAALNVSTVYNSGITPLRIWIVLYVITIIIAISTYVFCRYSSNDFEALKKISMVSVILWTFALILLVISVDYLRILRMVSFFYFILITNLFYKVDVRKKYKVLIVGTIVAVLLMLSQCWIYGIDFESVRGLLSVN